MAVVGRRPLVDQPQDTDGGQPQDTDRPDDFDAKIAK